MLQVEQVLQNRYQLQCQLGNNGVRQTWLALDLQAVEAENKQIALGAKGNEWAWRSRRWRSIEQFKAHQRG